MTEHDVLNQAIAEALKMCKDKYEDGEHIFIIAESDLRLIIKHAVEKGRREALRGN